MKDKIKNCLQKGRDLMETFQQENPPGSFWFENEDTLFDERRHELSNDCQKYRDSKEKRIKFTVFPGYFVQPPMVVKIKVSIDSQGSETVL
ncbi:hypothetical protein H6G00_22180 [Leptolyngbya sp. FACHB-541]|uniref:hypothetical protein n=1 Tax=Leptolyngbya sp. FACHB-541 TaxID=2692810 RepID=UPI001686F5E7|nr:hypothetical protein [Leptolyngbya sp. FACHB-541]MBD1999286.1 hypothetical protein [Leptolyngbya sp. FACHB-541]